jgi:hypothetical protein
MRPEREADLVSRLRMYEAIPPLLHSPWWRPAWAGNSCSLLLVPPLFVSPCWPERYISVFAANKREPLVILITMTGLNAISAHNSSNGQTWNEKRERKLLLSVLLVHNVFGTWITSSVLNETRSRKGLNIETWWVGGIGSIMAVYTTRRFDTHVSSSGGSLHIQSITCCLMSEPSVFVFGLTWRFSTGSHHVFDIPCWFGKTVSHLKMAHSRRDASFRKLNVFFW